jgi:hypothetical protein
MQRIHFAFERLFNMSEFHGENKKHQFFEGWYFKHQLLGRTLAFIPGMNVDKDGKKSAFIQVNTNECSYHIHYDYTDFSASKDKLFVKIGGNTFSKDGVILDINRDNFKCRGVIKYFDLTPLRYNIMGPFGILPDMECNHGIISLHHALKGEVELNGESIPFHQGVGYIEKDWGSSFPKSYLWFCANDFLKEKCCAFVSVADIPFAGRTFKGCIAVVYHKGREYRFATYFGVKVLSANDKKIELRQGKYRLEITLKGSTANPLYAPKHGNMERVILESLSKKAEIKFFINDKIILNEKTENACFEYAD